MMEPTTEKKKCMKRNLRDILPVLYTLPVLFFITFLLLIIGQIVGSQLLHGITAAVPSLAESDAWTAFTFYGEFIGIWLVMIAALWIFKKNRPILACVGTKVKTNNLVYLGIGIALGFGMNAFCAFIAWLNQDIRLSFDSFKPVSFVIIFAAVFVQSSAEELLCRCYLYQKLLKSYKNPLVAIIGNAMFFALLHLMNDGITVWSFINIAINGILYSMIVYYTGSLWCVFAAHTGWNFTQNIILGLPNSGSVQPYSVLKPDAVSATSSFAYDVVFGVEGSIVTTVVSAAACIALYLWYRKHPKVRQRIAGDSHE